MFGWIHESFHQLVSRKYGKDVWTKILKLANFEEGTENEISKYYKDEETFRLVNAIRVTLGLSIEEIWEAYGCFLIQYTMETGWDDLLRAMSPDLEFKGFLEGLDLLHYFIDHVVYQTKLKGPTFRCEQSGDSLLLHYYSTRTNLYPIVKVARRIYNTEVILTVQEKYQNKINDSVLNEHVVFLITQVQSNFPTNLLVSQQIVSQKNVLNSFSNSYFVTNEDFCKAFPYHVCFDSNLKIEHCGLQIQIAYPWIKPSKTIITDILELIHPEIKLSFDTIAAFRNGNFVFRLRDITSENQKTENKTSKEAAINLKGTMHSVGNNNYMCYMCSLDVTNINELIKKKLFISNIQIHDSTRDLIMLNQSRLSQVELKFVL